jgi:hypothetical protein
VEGEARSGLHEQGESMRARGAVLAVVMGGLLAGGCIQGQRTIKVNADGSGTVVDTTKLIGMAAAMKDMGEKPNAQAKVNREADLKKKAAAQGLTFVSAETGTDGAEKVTYSFKDVTKTTMNRSAEMPNEKKDEKEEAAKKEELLTFRMARAGDKSTLTVVVPKDAPADKKADGEKKDAKPSNPEEEKQAMAMMKGMMAGLKLSTVVEVNGKIVKTTAPYPPQGSAVTLMEMDFDQMGDDGLARLAALSDQPNPPTPEQLKGLKGVKFTEGEIVIEFSGK